MEFETIIGLLAALFTTVAFLPQAIKAWKTKSTKDLSLPTFVVYWSGIVLWLIYGLMISNLPIIAANVITLILASTIVVIKIKYK